MATGAATRFAPGQLFRLPRVADARALSAGATRTTDDDSDRRPRRLPAPWAADRSTSAASTSTVRRAELRVVDDRSSGSGEASAECRIHLASGLDPRLQGARARARDPLSRSAPVRHSTATSSAVALGAGMGVSERYGVRAAGAGPESRACRGRAAAAGSPTPSRFERPDRTIYPVAPGRAASYDVLLCRSSPTCRYRRSRLEASARSLAAAGCVRAADRDHLRRHASRYHRAERDGIDGRPSCRSGAAARCVTAARLRARAVALLRLWRAGAADAGSTSYHCHNIHPAPAALAAAARATPARHSSTTHTSSTASPRLATRAPLKRLTARSASRWPSG